MARALAQAEASVLVPLLTVLWNVLADVDELSACTGMLPPWPCLCIPPPAHAHEVVSADQQDYLHWHVNDPGFSKFLSTLLLAITSAAGSLMPLQTLLIFPDA